MPEWLQKRHTDWDSADKVLIVEGQTDKERIEAILSEPVSIVCTRGTLSYETVEEEIVPLQDSDVYILVDADEPGNKLRKQLRQELPNATHLYTKRMYREVATTPMSVLARVLQSAHFEINESWLQDIDGKELSIYPRKEERERERDSE